MFSKKNKKIELIPKLLITFFIIIACVQTISALALFNSPEYVLAKENHLDPYTLQTQIGDEPEIKFTGTTKPIADYIKIIYKYAIGVVGIISAVVLMFGGVIWLTAGGNTSRVQEAKEWIGASLTGLVLVLCSYIIFSQINPNLVNFVITDIKPLPGIENSEGTGIDKGQGENLGNCKSIVISEPKWDKCIYYTNLVGSFYLTEYDMKNCLMEDDGETLCCCAGESQRIKYGCPKDLWPHACSFCDCIKPKLLFKNPKSNQLNKKFAKKLVTINQKKIETIETINWIVTEAWPPSRVHKDPCHTKGTCADIAFLNASYTEENIKAFVDAFKGLRVVYECKGAGCCSKVGLSTKGGGCWEDTGNWISGPHFSVYDK